MEVAELLSRDETYTFPKAGLGVKTIEEIISKHMQERRREEHDPLSSSENSDSSGSSNSPTSSTREEKVRSYGSYSLMVGVVLFVISGYGKSFCPFLESLKTF